MGLGTPFRGLYNLRNIVSYGLRQYSAGHGALGIEFRGPRRFLRMQGVWTPCKDDGPEGLRNPSGVIVFGFRTHHCVRKYIFEVS